MEITIQPVTNLEDEAAMLSIRQRVFNWEMGVVLPSLTRFGELGATHLLARAGPEGNPVAALSVVDTSADRELHQRYGLEFALGSRVARYTQLAVISPYRGLNIPIRLILEAHRRFVVPKGFDYTWLLFAADRAYSSALCARLAFAPSRRTFITEYGLTRVLVRDERSDLCAETVRRTAEQMAQSEQSISLVRPAPPLAGSQAGRNR